MKNLDLIAEELFNKVRGRFPSVTIGDVEGKVTNVPKDARDFDFDFKEGDLNLGKVSISLSEEAVEVMYADNFVGEQDEITKDKWYNFLRELRQFSKKRLMKFDTRNINKSNLDRRDYQFLATNRGDNTMAESKLYGTSKLSYQNIDSARLVIKHTESINQESVNGRIRNIGKIYIESAEGERFLYPYKHLTGARAMARHVAEGGKPHDDFGTHIVGLSEELNKLRKFKTYMGRSSVMAESLKDYMPVVQDRISTVKKTIESLQKPAYYKTAFESFEKPMMEEVPNDVAENWIDQLTIRQFNEELKDVFPYIYNLVSEATKAKELGPEEVVEGGIMDFIKDKYADFQQGREDSMNQYKQDLHILRTVLSQGGMDDATINKIENGCLNDPRVCLYNTIRKNGVPAGDMDMEVKRIGDELNSGWTTRAGTTDEAIEDAFESMMGQFAENKTWIKDGVEMCPEACCGKPVTECSCGPDCKHCNCYEKNKKNESKTEGNKFSMALKKAKDDDEDEMEVDGKKIPVTEFVLSLFDRETGQFPKGETAVLTAIEKDYGEQYIEPAKQFIERINATYEQYATPAEEIVIADDESEGTVMEPTIGQEEALEEAGAEDFEAKFRAIQQRGGAVAVSIHGLLKDSGLDADQIMGFDPNIPSNRTRSNQFQQSRQEEVLQKAQQALGSTQGGQAQPQAGGEDLGDGFQKTKHKSFGDGVLDTQSGSSIFVNGGKVRSPGKYIIVDKNGKTQTTMQLGPMTTKAMQAAGLGESQEYNDIMRLAGL